MVEKVGQDLPEVPSKVAGNGKAFWESPPPQQYEPKLDEAQEVRVPSYTPSKQGGK